MLLLLSPAKSLDYETPEPAGLAHTLPEFRADAAALVALLRARTPAEIAALMDLSEPLAALNVGRYAAWSSRFTAANSKAAVLAFNGDVYEGLDAASLGAEDLAWAQQHLGILSGLYGLLRPLDRLQPYRLEMGTRLANPRGKDLYAWWGPRLAEALDQRLAKDPAPLLVNLASEEYFKAVARKALRSPVLHCAFEDWKGGSWKVISFHAKRARGLMARHAILQRAHRPEQLQAFAAEGYAYEPAASQPGRYVFRRRLGG